MENVFVGYLHVFLFPTYIEYQEWDVQSKFLFDIVSANNLISAACYEKHHSKIDSSNSIPTYDRNHFTLRLSEPLPCQKYYNPLKKTYEMINDFCVFKIHKKAHEESLERRKRNGNERKCLTDSSNCPRYPASIKLLRVPVPAEVDTIVDEHENFIVEDLDSEPQSRVEPQPSSPIFGQNVPEDVSDSGDHSSGFLNQFLNIILTGGVIHSDEWAAYNSLSQIGYFHETVNHSQHYVDPVTGAHTQGIERAWRDAKVQLVKVGCGTSDRLLSGHLAQFWWNSCHGKQKCQNPFYRLLALIAKHHDVS